MHWCVWQAHKISGTLLIASKSTQNWLSYSHLCYFCKKLTKCRKAGECMGKQCIPSDSNQHLDQFSYSQHLNPCTIGWDRSKSMVFALWPKIRLDSVNERSYLLILSEIISNFEHIDSLKLKSMTNPLFRIRGNIYLYLDKGFGHHREIRLLDLGSTPSEKGWVFTSFQTQNLGQYFMVTLQSDSWWADWL